MQVDIDPEFKPAYKSLAELTKSVAKGMVARNRVEFLISLTIVAPTPTCVSMPGS